MEDAGGIGGGESNENGGNDGGAALEAAPLLPVEIEDGGSAALAISTPTQLVVAGLPGSLVKVDDWRKAGIAILDAAPDGKAGDPTRTAVKEAAERVVKAAESVDDIERQVAAAEVVQRCNRAIGKAHGAGRPRDRGGRPRKGAEKPSTAGKVSASAASNYRRDAESVTDEAFEVVAAAAREAVQPLDRRTVRSAGEHEAAGGDPADAVREPKVPEHKPRRERSFQPSVHSGLLAAVRAAWPEGCGEVDGPVTLSSFGGQKLPVDLGGYDDEWDTGDGLERALWVCPALHGADLGWADRIMDELDLAKRDPAGGGRLVVAIVALSGRTDERIQQLLSRPEARSLRGCLAITTRRGCLWDWVRRAPACSASGGALGRR